MKRMISLLLALVMLLSNIPAVVFATEGVTESVAETEAAATEETTAPTQPAVPEETSAPTEETVPATEFVEEIVAPTETTESSEVTVTDEAVMAVTVVASGTCGDNLTWKLDAEGTLTISGTGSMSNYSYGASPWYDYREQIKAAVIEEGLTSIGERAFHDCTRLKSIELPDSLTSIGGSAFAGCSSLTSIEIPDRVTSIGGGAFYNCSSLTSIDLPVSLTSIGGGAFSGCNRLKSIDLPDSVTSIGDSAFQSCTSLTSIELPDSLTSIGGSAFRYCSSLTSIDIPYGVTSIGAYAFMSCRGLTSIDIPTSVTSIGRFAFHTCSSLTSIELPESLTSIGMYAFLGCTGLTSIDLPDGLTSIGEAVFSACSHLTSIDLPDGLTSIGERAFHDCTRLKSIELPDSLTSIGGSAFAGCSSLTGIHVSAGNAAFCSDAAGVLYTKDMSRLIRSPAKIKGMYQIPACVTSIGDYAFNGCTGLTSIDIPAGVTSIGKYAFSYCTGLTSIDIPAGVTSIGESAFEYCTSLTGIAIPNGVTSIAYLAFYHCTRLTSIDIPAGVTSIGKGAFEYCTGLTSIDIPAGVTSIGEGAFWNCTNLIAIELPDGLETIENNTFVTCAKLKSIVIPASVTSIDTAAIQNCTQLKEITFIGDAPDIHVNFLGTEDSGALPIRVTIYYPAGNPTWTADIMRDYGGQVKWVAKCTNHTKVIEGAIEATCTEAGMSGTITCSACGELLAKSEVIPALGHDFDVIITDATCTADGEKQSHCLRCGHTETEVLPALGHKEVIDKGFDPTCTEAGLSDGKHCDRCGEVYVVQEVIPANGHQYEEQDDRTVCTGCHKEIYVQILHDAIYLDLNFLTGMQLEYDVSDYLENSIQWYVDDAAVLTVNPNGFVTVAGEGSTYVKAAVEADGVTFISMCRVDVTENVQILGVQLSTDKVTTELYKDDFATFEILLDLPQNRPFTGDELVVTDEAAMSASGLENKSNLIESVQFKTISDLFELVLLDDRTVQIVPTQKAMESGKTLKSSYTDTVIVKIKGEEEPREEELKLTLTVKKTQPKPKAKINAFNSFYEGQSQEIVITGADVTGIRKNENVATPIPTWLTLEDGRLTLNGNTPKSSDKAYLWVDVDGFRYPVELTLTVKHSKKAPTLKFAKSSVTLNKAAEQQIEVAVTSSDAAYIIENPDIRITGGKMGDLEASYSNGILTVTTTAKTPDMGTYKVYLNTPGCKEVAVTVKVTKQEPSVSYKAATLDLSFPETAGIVVPTFKNYSGGFEIESMHAQNAKKLYVDFFRINKDGKNILVTCDEDTPTGSYNLDVKLKLDDGQTINGTAKVNVKRTAVKLKVSTSKVSLNKELPDQAVVEVSCTTKNYKFDLDDAVLTYDDKMLDIERAGNALIIKLKDGAEYGKTYPVSVSADYKGAPVAKLNVAVLKKDSVVKSTIKATSTLDVIREGTAITIKPTYTNYLNVNVDEDAVLKIYSSKDSFKKAIAEVYAENGIFTIGSSVISNHMLKYKAQLETKVGGKIIKSNQISLSVKMGAAKLTAKSSGTTMFAKDRNDRALVWFESSDATLNDVASIEIKDAKYKDAFEIIDYRDGSFAIAFKDGKLHESIAKQLEKKSSISITLNLNVFIEGNVTVDPAISKTAKANTTQKVKLTIVK